MLLLACTGWINRRQQHVVNYLLEENRVLRKQIGDRRLKLTDCQRRRLAVKGKSWGVAFSLKLPLPSLLLRFFAGIVAW